MHFTIEISHLKCFKSIHKTNHIILIPYSYLNDSIGLNFAARIAGKIPKIKPIAVENDSAKIIGVAVITAFRLLKDDKTHEIRYASPIPSTPPARLNMILSVKNWINISLFFAPRDFLIPISRVLSVTDTNMMFIMPMPPTISEIAAIAVVIPAMAVKRRLVG